MNKHYLFYHPKYRATETSLNQSKECGKVVIIEEMGTMFACHMRREQEIQILNVPLNLNLYL